VSEQLSPPLSGRRAQAARNDRLILESARAVFVADPGAPIAAVAEHAGVGISALYRRYASKEELLRQLNRDSLADYIADVEAALADDGDPWEAFVGFMRRRVAADSHSLTLRLAGTFTPTEDLYRQAERGRKLTQRLFERTQRSGAMRPDLVVDDLSFLFEQLAAVRVADPDRTGQLRMRYLTLLLESMRRERDGSLPGPPPTWHELTQRWQSSA
jgi:AcrR family transcriptional regulator